MQDDRTTEEYVLSDEPEEDSKRKYRTKLISFLESKYFVSILIILLAVIAFSLGRISGLEDKKVPVKVISGSASVNNPLNPPYIKRETGQTATVGASVVGKSESVVASKNGTKYHYPWCAGAKQISDKNKITFDSIESARAKGYTPANNCKGLK